MMIEWSEPFRKDFKNLPEKIQKLFEKKMQLAMDTEFSHPSLRVKKMQGHVSIWEASLNMNYRITFHKTLTGVFLRRVGTHNMLRNP